MAVGTVTVTVELVVLIAEGVAEDVFVAVLVAVLVAVAVLVRVALGEVLAEADWLGGVDDVADALGLVGALAEPLALGVDVGVGLVVGPLEVSLTVASVLPPNSKSPCAVA